MQPLGQGRKGVQSDEQRAESTEKNPLPPLPPLPLSDLSRLRWRELPKALSQERPEFRLPPFAPGPVVS